MKTFNIQEGDQVIHQGKEYTVNRIVNLQWIIGQERGSFRVEKLKISDIAPKTNFEENEKEIQRQINIDLSTEEEWQIGKKRLEIIVPVINKRGDGKVVEEVSAKSGVSIPTLYRWVEMYETTNLMSSLVPKENTGGRGISRLSPEIDAIINTVIEDCYLTKQKKTVQKICIEVSMRCKNAGIKPPHNNTIRYRINQISEYQRLKGRYGKKAAEQKFSPKVGTFPGANFPLSVVQIDHTKLDIMVVDEVYRRSIGRPWITMAIDIYSRMCIGFYISLDPPGAMGTGLCICHSILPKEKWLAKMDIDGEWPCWGIMQVIHVDNAKEFKGTMIKRACEEHNIQLEWRPVATPHYGGHIERLLGTFLHELHSLPGTTFANIKDRKNYNSEKEASLTLSELEKWLTIFIVNVYHRRIHKSIDATPFAKYNEGIFGTNEQIGIGIPPRIMDERKLRLDFMPFVERTIQDYGVIIDNVYYYHDVLRRWINSSEPGIGKNRVKRKFVFKRDPRDISNIYFFDPELNDYYPIPYRNTSHPPMSIWEFNEIISKLKEQGKEEVNEDMIFEAYEVLRKIEEDSILKTKNNKKVRSKILRRAQSRDNREDLKKDFFSPDISAENFTIPTSETIQPFDDIEF